MIASGHKVPLRGLSLTFAGTPLAVRGALGDMMCAASDMGLDADMRDTLQLVAAEVLNNIVEHAYGGENSGQIEMRLTCSDCGLYCVFLDEGAPMPGNVPPGGAAHDLTRGLQDLPEGGFGWFLIRRLVRDLRYTRIGHRNRLSFRIAGDRVANAPQAGSGGQPL